MNSYVQAENSSESFMTTQTKRRMATRRQRASMYWWRALLRFRAYYANASPPSALTFAIKGLQDLIVWQDACRIEEGAFGK